MGGGVVNSPGNVPAGVKYSATAAGGVAFGGLFPLFLFDKFGIAKLFNADSTATAAVYAFTVFAMVSFLILGIGSFLAKDGQLQFKRNALFYIVVLVFATAFIAGFVYFMGTARPELKVKISFDRYKEDVTGFKDMSLSPFISHPNKDAVSSAESTLPVTGDTQIVFGLDSLHDLETNYGTLKATLEQHYFDNGTMGKICAMPDFADNVTCNNWAHPGAPK